MNSNHKAVPPSPSVSSASSVPTLPSLTPPTPPTSSPAHQPAHIADDQALVSEVSDASNTSGKAASIPIPVSIVSKNRLIRDSLTDLLTPYLNLRLVRSYSSGFSIPSIPLTPLIPPALSGPPDPQGKLSERLDSTVNNSPNNSPTQPELPSLPNPLGHVVLLDYGIGPERVMAWTRYWRGLQPPARVLMMDMPNNPDVIITCIEAGVGGYTLQGASATEIAKAIKRIGQGLVRCSPEITAHLFARLAANAAITATGATKLAKPTTGRLPDRLHIPTKLLNVNLTPRELQVLRLIVQGQDNNEIAERLHIQTTTIKYHVHNLLRKLKLPSRQMAAYYAKEHGWFE